jgi:hypothetical protein
MCLEKYRQLFLTNWNSEYFVFLDGVSHGDRNQWENEYPQSQPKRKDSPRTVGFIVDFYAFQDGLLLLVRFIMIFHDNAIVHDMVASFKYK